MPYTIISKEDRLKFAPELVGTGHMIVSDGEKMWIVKHKPGSVDEEKRDLLGYQLGYKFANVIEVKLLTPEEHQQIRTLSNKGDDSIPDNTFLVRLAGSYSLDNFPCKTLEQAVAAELIYSVWIRRRDAHVDNRVYVNGIPAFFDYQTAFLGEPRLTGINVFFATPTNYGEAGAWRVKILENNMTLLTRGVNKTFSGGNHYVNDIEKFKEEIKVVESELKNSLDDNWENLISNAGFPEQQRTDIASFLKKNLETLSVDLEKMKEVIFQN